MALTDSYTITAEHESPPNPGQTFSFNVQTGLFEPAQYSWTDFATTCRQVDGQPVPYPGGCGPDDPDYPDCLEGVLKRRARPLMKSQIANGLFAGAFHSRANKCNCKGIKPLDGDTCDTSTTVSPVDTGGECATGSYTITYTACTPSDLGTDPAWATEDYVQSTYYVQEYPSITVQLSAVLLHYRGTNPTRAELDAELADDVFRAICWKESSWRQFDGNNKPVYNPKSNDWGCMQINTINVDTPLILWDYRANIAKARAIFAFMKPYAVDYLDQQPAGVTDDMILNETLQSYNGGQAATYYQWIDNKWQAQPPNNYVALVRGFMRTKPWPKATG
jgi:hypothetical protein